MGRLDPAPAEVQGRAADRADVQALEKEARPEDIDEGVVRPGLVKVDLVQGMSVNPAFGPKQVFENHQSLVLDRGGELGPLDEGLDIGPAPWLGRFFFQDDIHFQAAQAAPLGLGDTQGDRKAERFHLLLEHVPREPEVEKRPEDHVPAQA